MITSAGAAHEFVVPGGVTARLTELARRHDATLFMLLTAACQVLFHRWSGQDDIAVGTVATGRDRPGVEPIIGFFVTTLVLRASIDGQRLFTDFLADVRQVALDAFAHQDAPFEHRPPPWRSPSRRDRRPRDDRPFATQAARARSNTLGLLRLVRFLPLRWRQAGIVRGLRGSPSLASSAATRRQALHLRPQRPDQHVLLGVAQAAEVGKLGHP